MGSPVMEQQARTGGISHSGVCPGRKRSGRRHRSISIKNKGDEEKDDSYLDKGRAESFGRAFTLLHPLNAALRTSPGSRDTSAFFGSS